MGLRQTAFAELLVDAGVARSETVLLVPTLESIAAAKLGGLVTETYRRLGGVNPTPRVRPGQWDVATEKGAWELDEEQHFNRFRLVTLRSAIYRRVAGFDHASYRVYCSAKEDRCLRKAGSRGYWSSSSSVAEFGPAGEPGVLAGAGSPRWKQRAFYDFIKDLSPFVLDIPVTRLSIWDDVACSGDIASLGWVLDQSNKNGLRSKAWRDALAELCMQKASLAARELRTK
jgi:hypothetical protein